MATYYSRSIIIDHTKVSADQVDFPLLISGTFTDLRYKGYGGHVAFTDGRDIVVYADAGLTQLLDFELDKYVASSGQLVLWVRIPSLSASSDTTIYIKYGQASATSLANPTGVWDERTRACYHFSGSGSTTPDSTANHLTGTLHGGVTISAGAFLGDAASFPSSGNGSITAASVFPIGTTEISLSIWAKGNRNQFGSLLNTGVSEIWQGGDGSGSITGYFYAGGQDDQQNLHDSFDFTDGNWHHYAYTSKAGAQALYIDGEVVQTGSYAIGPAINQATQIVLGNLLYGSLDEARVSDTVRSADWIATEYANQSSPSTFVTLGSELSSGDQVVSVIGIPSALAFGTPTLSTMVTVSVAGIPSGEAFGTPHVVAENEQQEVTLVGIPSEEAFGTPTITTSIEIEVTGIESEEALGAPTVVANFDVVVTSIPSHAMVGTPTVEGGEVEVAVTGIPTGESWNRRFLAQATFEATAVGIPSQEAFGEISVAVGTTVVAVPGIASGEVFGKISVSVTEGDTTTVVVGGIPSGEAFGTPSVSTSTTVNVSGIDSEEAFGDIAITLGTVEVSVAGIPSRETFGRITVSQPKRVPTIVWVNPAAIDSGVALSAKQLNARCTDTTGTFIYNPPIGTILPQGLQRLAVAFTPNSSLWTTASAEVLIQVGADVTAPAKTFAVNLKYRRQDANGDFVLGTGNDYHINSPAAVGQAVRTRLLLFQDEYHLDVTQGVPWSTEILGHGRTAYDTIIRETITSTPGVDQLVSYTSAVSDRTLTVNARISTIYGGEISLSLPITPSISAPVNLATPLPAPASAPATTLRVRKQDSNGDFVLGTGNDYLVNSPAAVAQIVLTRLRLWTGEYHLDATQGTPWAQSVLGEGQSDPSAALKDRILSTPGVVAITSWSATEDPITRALSISAGLETLYGETVLTASV